MCVCVCVCVCADLVEQLGWLDLCKEAEINNGQLTSNLLRIKIKNTQHWRGTGRELEREEEGEGEEEER